MKTPLPFSLFLVAPFLGLLAKNHLGQDGHFPGQQFQEIIHREDAHQAPLIAYHHHAANGLALHPLEGVPDAG
jgi:hypothetical protein